MLTINLALQNHNYPTNHVGDILRDHNYPISITIDPKPKHLTCNA